MLIENGVYPGLVKDVSLYLRGDQDRLTAAFQVECEGKELVHREWLERNDGSMNEKAIRRMRQCFPNWDGSIESLEEGFCVRDVEVDVTIENEPDREDPEKWWTRTKYIDPPGGASAAGSMPDGESRATLVSKYGARFRALAGGKSVQRAVGSGGSRLREDAPACQGGQLAGGGDGSGGGPVSPGRRDAVAAPTGAGRAASASAAAPAQPARTPPPAARPLPGAQRAAEAEPAAVSTLEDCWEALCQKHPDEFREDVTERWYALLDRVVPDRDQADFSPEDWGAVLTEIALPF